MIFQTPPGGYRFCWHLLRLEASQKKLNESQQKRPLGVEKMVVRVVVLNFGAVWCRNSWTGKVGENDWDDNPVPA